MVLFVRSADVFYDFVDWDEASLMAQAWAMTRGEVLYRDVPQIHGVLNIAIFVPFFSIFNAIAAPHAIKTMNLALVLLGAFMIRGIARRWLGRLRPRHSSSSRRRKCAFPGGCWRWARCSPRPCSSSRWRSSMLLR
jgi:hypothetical protein